MKESVLNFIAENWLLLSPLVYEILARIWPTKWNISLLDNLRKILDIVVPNIRKVQPEDNIIKEEIKGAKKRLFNKVVVNAARHILPVILFVCVAFATRAQIWQPFKGIRLVNEYNDTTGVLQVNGSIFYCQTCSPPAFYALENGVWKRLISTATGTVAKAGNGLTLVGSDSIAGGGPLQDFYDITMNGNDVSFNSATTGDYEVQLTDGDITHQTTNGVITQSSTGYFGTVSGNNNSYQIFTSDPGQRIQFFANGAANGAVEATSDTYSLFMGNDGFIEKFEIAGTAGNFSVDLQSGDYGIIADNISLTANPGDRTLGFTSNGGSGLFINQNNTDQDAVGVFENDPVAGALTYALLLDYNNITGNGAGAQFFDNTPEQDGLRFAGPYTYTGDSSTLATKGYVDSRAGASAAGANTQIQFNNSGAFGASADLTFNDATNAFAVGTLGTITVGGGTLITGSSIGFPGAGNDMNYNAGRDVSINPGRDLIINVPGTAGNDIRIPNATNSAGTATLVAGTVTVSNVKVTANSRIFLTSQVDGGTPGFLRVSGRSAGVSFTITSSSGTDTSTVAWLIIEP